MIWQNKTVVFLDLETTGLTPGQDRTVEIGALKTKNRKEGRIICNIKRGKTEREIL
ncbi:MAG: exonuclease domain-containing protein [Candidatus Omnitrophota bacterium]